MKRYGTAKRFTIGRDSPDPRRITITAGFTPLASAKPAAEIECVAVNGLLMPPKQLAIRAQDAFVKSFGPTDDPPAHAQGHP